jgi:hypothetical protein
MAMIPGASTGWETLLDAVIRAGFAIGGTWPMRTEKPGRMRENDSNALASSIILVCRPRAANAPMATRRDFRTALNAELPEALKNLQRSNIAPVDLAQAAFGPGRSVYTRYAKVAVLNEPLAHRPEINLMLAGETRNLETFLRLQEDGINGLKAGPLPRGEQIIGIELKELIRLLCGRGEVFALGEIALRSGEEVL